MSTDTNTNAQSAAPASTPERVYIPIPKAGPGQGYKAPKNTQDPLGGLIWRAAVVALSVSLPLAPALIFFMILAFSNAIKDGLLWLWIPMIIFIEAIAIPVAIGVGREALGISGSALRDRAAS